MRKLFSTKKRIAVVAAAGAIVLAASGIAAAYFTYTGTATGHASVATVGWTVTDVSVAGNPLTPGGPGQTVSFSVNNTANIPVVLTTVTLTLDSSGGYVIDQNTGLPATANGGCALSWFSVANDGNGLDGATFTAGQSVADYATISIPTDNTDNQNGCQGVFPEFTITATT